MLHIDTQFHRDQLVSEIEQQLGRVLSPHVRESLLQVPRHLFVDQYYQQRGNSLAWDLVDAPVLEDIYSDQPLVTKIDVRGMPSSSSSQPSLMALQLEALDLQCGHRGLEIGTGTGYNAALMGQMVGRSGQVVSIDIDEKLVSIAKIHLSHVELENVLVIEGDGYEGNTLHAPYDRVLATCGMRALPRPWLSQVAQGGVLVGNVLLNVASIFVRLEKVGATKLQGQLLPIEGKQYMEMQRPGSLPSPKWGTRWKKYDVLPHHDVECNLMNLLDNAAYSVLLQCMLPTVSKHYRWDAGNEQPDLYLRTSDGTAAVQIQHDRIRVYGQNEQLETLIKQSIALFDHLGRPHLGRYHVVISEEQASIALDDLTFSLAI
jgi:protein-L-isoaspartate(D-aspartate) O-methyltransferase